MSPERLERLGWALVGASLACLAALQWIVLRDLDQWDAWPVALLLHVAMATSIAAHGLTWRRGGSTLRGLAQILAGAAVLGWLYTWFEPLPEAIAWVRNLALRQFGP